MCWTERVHRGPRGRAGFAILTAAPTFGGLRRGIGRVLCADTLSAGWGLAVIGSGLLVGIGVGLSNGLVVTKLGIPPFIATLAMMLLARGAAYKYTNARTISGLPPSFAALGQGWVPVAVMAAVFALAWLLLMRTPFGRHVYATGGNREAAWLAGIRGTGCCRASSVGAQLSGVQWFA
jgi:ribose transport system permease protein